MTKLRLNISAISLITKKKIFNLTYKVRPNYMLITRDLSKTNSERLKTEEWLKMHQENEKNKKGRL